MDADALCDQGIALNAAGRFAEAADRFGKALELRPDFSDARFNLATSLAALERLDEAIALLRQVLERAPQSADAWSNLGALLMEHGEGDAAVAALERALGLRPGLVEALNNLGTLLEERGRRREAIALYRSALQANPTAARIAYNLGLAHLREHEFEPGWRLCEARYHTTPPVTQPPLLTQPEFSPADFGLGRRIAVWREQGLGDQILYATLLPELEARGERFVVEVDARLVPAFRRAHPAWKVVAPDEARESFAQCDRHIALGSLPRLLRPDRASFAGQPRSLLAADAGRAGAFRSALSADGKRIVGISWRSFQAMRGTLQRKKCAPLAMFMGLSRQSDLRLVDLQYGDTAAERQAFAAAGGHLTRPTGLDVREDVDGVLAAIEACDAVVTTSNVTAHFAGALGKPAWVVHAGANPPFYYWVAGADGRSLWYPSVRVVSLPSWDAFQGVMQTLQI